MSDSEDSQVEGIRAYSLVTAALSGLADLPPYRLGGHTLICIFLIGLSASVSATLPLAYFLAWLFLLLRQVMHVRMASDEDAEEDQPLAESDLPGPALEALHEACRMAGIAVPVLLADDAPEGRNAASVWAPSRRPQLTFNVHLLRELPEIVPAMAAHEVGHLHYRDSWYMSGLYACLTNTRYVAASGILVAALAARDSIAAGAFPGFGSLVFLSLCVFIAVVHERAGDWPQRHANHCREYAADAFAARVVGAEAVIVMLETIIASRFCQTRDRGRASFTHPSIASRVEALQHRNDDAYVMLGGAVAAVIDKLP